ncbi:hypothetical protein IMSHALPRED_008286 [Imshaugia aleurites]|uniref:NmrA-like domain-containing protein n=1 Tax=Imshaugia aleurites TaxID=172621 RepID=A0A8H3FRD7_9LECA|nr:hypothetical protein IMSHALPRED_008286 [Imshaugia aleurites]
MVKLLTVFGATGQQGGSVVDYVMNDPELSKQFKLRGITRDLSKPAAQSLRLKGVEVVEADANDKESLKQAMHGAHTIFGITATIYDEKLKEREFAQGKAMADAAVAAGVQYFIFSTLSNGAKLSGGKIQKLAHFDVKAEIEEYIRAQPMKSAFFAPGSFMQNFAHFMAPRPAGDGTYAIANFVTPETQLPLIDTVDDSGKYVGAILAEPEKYEGKVLSAATRLYSYSEIVNTMSRASGKTVSYKQLPLNVWRSFLPNESAEYMVDMFFWIQDYGYYGPQTEELVDWTAKQARGKLTTLEEYLAKHPLHLQ